jgi:hypothetical protein
VERVTCHAGGDGHLGKGYGPAAPSAPARCGRAAIVDYDNLEKPGRSAPHRTAARIQVSPPRPWCDEEAHPASGCSYPRIRAGECRGQSVFCDGTAGDLYLFLEQVDDLLVGEDSVSSSAISSAAWRDGARHWRLPRRGECAGEENLSGSTPRGV